MPDEYGSKSGLKHSSQSKPSNKGSETVKLPRAVQAQNKTGLGNSTYGTKGGKGKK